MTEIIFIASMAHSGSTMLDLILGSHPKMVGLGEIFYVIKAFQKPGQDIYSHTCSCGNSAAECPFWRHALDRLSKTVPTDLESGYRAVIETFEEIFADQMILVDSSKYLPSLEIVSGFSDYQMKVIHLLKDVRAFTISSIDRQREARNHVRIGSAYRAFRAWDRVNRRIGAELSSNRIPFIRVGYEELCLATEHTLENLVQFIQVDPDRNALSIAGSGSHCLIGNRMRLDGARMKIRYDSRWLNRKEWLLPSLFFRRTMDLNQSWVYSNGIAKIHEREAGNAP